MAGGAKGIPEGVSVVTPRLFCRDVVAAIDFCRNTFGAVERLRRPGPDGAVAHALMTIGPAMIMFEAEWPGMASRPPQPDGSSPVVIYVYVEDVDKTVERAVAGGAKVLFPVQNQFWGDRIGWVMDPSGHVWTVATRIEETTEEERQERLSRLMAATNSNTEPAP
jgi:PhnB protein